VLDVLGLPVVTLKNISNERLVKYLALRVPQLRFGSWNNDYTLRLTNSFGELNFVSFLAPHPDDDITLFNLETANLSSIEERSHYYTVVEAVPKDTQAVIDITLRRAAYVPSKAWHFAKCVGLNLNNNLQTLKVSKLDAVPLFIKNQNELNDTIDKIVTGLQRNTLYDCARALIDNKMGSAAVCQQCPDQLSCLAIASIDTGE